MYSLARDSPRHLTVKCRTHGRGAPGRGTARIIRRASIWRLLTRQFTFSLALLTGLATAAVAARPAPAKFAGPTTLRCQATFAGASEPVAPTGGRVSLSLWEVSPCEIRAAVKRAPLSTCGSPRLRPSRWIVPGVWSAPDSFLAADRWRDRYGASAPAPSLEHDAAAEERCFTTSPNRRETCHFQHAARLALTSFEHSARLARQLRSHWQAGIGWPASRCIRNVSESIQESESCGN